MPPQIQKVQDEKAAAELKEQDQQFTVEQTQAVVDQIREAASAFMSYMQKRIATVEVKNQVKSVLTPDVDQAVQKLAKSQSNDSTQLLKAILNVNKALDSLPDKMPKVSQKDFPEAFKVSNQIDYSDAFKELRECIDKLEMKPVFDPKITVKPTPVTVSNDFSSVLGALDALRGSVEAIDIQIPPTPDIDNKDVVEAVKSVRTAINNIMFPVPNQVHPFSGPTGQSGQANTDSEGNVQTVEAIKTNRYDLQAPIYYVGYANLNTSESDEEWVITKYDLTTNPYTGKAAVNVAWSNRASVIYG